MDKKNLLVALNYNNADFIEQFLNSLMIQDFNNWEIVIIDDCSNDNSPEIIKAFDFKCLSVNFIFNNKNLGINFSIKKALKGYKENPDIFVKLIATDDILAPGALRVLADVEPEMDFVYSDGYLIDANGTLFGDYETVEGKFFDKKYRSLASYVNFYPAPTAFIKIGIINEALDDYGEVRNAEDWPILMNIFKKNLTIRKIDFKTVYYRRHNNSLSYGFSNRKFEIPKKLKNDIVCILRKNILLENNYFARKRIDGRIKKITENKLNFYQIFHFQYLTYRFYLELNKILHAVRSVKYYLKKFLKYCGVHFYIDYEKRFQKFGSLAVNDLTGNNTHADALLLSQLKCYKIELEKIVTLLNGTVLDYGCGVGKFCPLFASLSFDRIEGYEPSHALHDVAKGYDKLYSQLSEISRKYDLIFVNNVLGGVSKADLCEFLNFCRGHLAENGSLCIIEVPFGTGYVELSWGEVDFKEIEKELNLVSLHSFYFYEKNVKLRGAIYGRLV